MLLSFTGKTPIASASPSLSLTPSHLPASTQRTLTCGLRSWVAPVFPGRFQELECWSCSLPVPHPRAPVAQTTLAGTSHPLALPRAPTTVELLLPLAHGGHCPRGASVQALALAAPKCLPWPFSLRNWWEDRWGCMLIAPECWLQ